MLFFRPQIDSSFSPDLLDRLFDRDRVEGVEFAEFAEFAEIVDDWPDGYRPTSVRHLRLDRGSIQTYPSHSYPLKAGMTTIRKEKRGLFVSWWFKKSGHTLPPIPLYDEQTRCSIYTNKNNRLKG